MKVLMKNCTRVNGYEIIALESMVTRIKALLFTAHHVEMSEERKESVLKELPRLDYLRNYRVPFSGSSEN